MKQTANSPVNVQQKTSSVTLQRQQTCSCGKPITAGGECADCRKKRESRQLQRSAINETSTPEEAPPIVYDVLRSPGQPLDEQTRTFMESRFGQDFSGVRIHTDSRAADSARAVNANAYTVGQHIAFGASRYSPNTTAGQHLLAHELAHTVQQTGKPGIAQAQLNVAAAYDPAETAADHAADAAMRNVPVPALGAASRALHRQNAGTPTTLAMRPQAEDTGDPNVKIVRSGGRRYRVTRQVTRRQRDSVSRVPSPTLTPGLDREIVWLDLTWCEGQTQGRVRVQADIPEQVLQVLLQTITLGGDIDSALRGASVTPSASAEIRISDWRITANGRIVINNRGTVTGGGGGITVETPWGFDIFGEGQRTTDPSTGRTDESVTGGIRIPLEPRRRSAPRCTERRVVVVDEYSYRCEEERDRPPLVREGVRQERRTEERQRYLYFNYANATLNSRESAQGLRDLVSDLHDGFRVLHVRGFTSPEGPVDPGRRFQGNRALSEERAQAAMSQVNALCRRERISGGCFAEGATQSGEVELYPLRDPVGGEIEGDPQAQEAADRFRTEPQEESRRTPAVTRRLERARTPQEQADIVYPLLRRAEIVLTRSRMVAVPFREEIAQPPERTLLENCPPGVAEIAFPPSRRPRTGGTR